MHFNNSTLLAKFFIKQTGNSPCYDMMVKKRI